MALFRHFGVLTLSFIIISLASTSSAQANSRNSLKISGQVDETITISLDEIKRLDQVVIDTSTPWTEGIVRFQGPLLSDVLKLAGPKGDWLMMKALDQYQASANLTKIEKYHPILAWKMDGKEMSIRTRGPYWVMFPIDQHEELKAHIYNDYMVWQLFEIEVLTQEP